MRFVHLTVVPKMLDKQSADSKYITEPLKSSTSDPAAPMDLIVITMPSKYTVFNLIYLHDFP